MVKNSLFVFLVLVMLFAISGQGWTGDSDSGASSPYILDLGKEMAEAKAVSVDPIVPEVTGFDPLNYTLGPEDVIEIHVLRHPEFSGVFPVNLEGKIQYKFVGDIEVTGLTKKKLEDHLKQRISKFVINPKIDVTILEYKSKVIFVLGEVASPGKYYMKSEQISVRDAVVAAGLPTHAAAMRKCQLVTPSENGDVEIQEVNMLEILYEGDLTNNINMSPGDVFYVPATVMAKLIRIINPVVAPVTSAASGARAASGGL